MIISRAELQYSERQWCFDADMDRIVCILARFCVYFTRLCVGGRNFSGKCILYIVICIEKMEKICYTLNRDEFLFLRCPADFCDGTVEKLRENFFIGTPLTFEKSLSSEATEKV